MQVHRFRGEDPGTVTHLLIAGVPVLRLEGTVVAQSLQAMRDTLNQIQPVLAGLLDNRPGPIIIDLSRMTACDLGGVAMIHAVTDAVLRARAHARVVAPHAPPAVAGLSLVPTEVPVFGTLGEALRAKSKVTAAPDV